MLTQGFDVDGTNFNQWTINDVAFAEDDMQPMFRVKLGKRYRLRMRNASIARSGSKPCHSCARIIIESAFQFLRL